MVIREVTKGVWTFSKPFSRFGLVPIGGRSTAVKLSDGGVWVLASTPLTEQTKVTLDKLGPVKYIIGPDSVHHLFLGEFKKAYPDAKLIAPEAAIERFEDKTLKVDGKFGADPPGTLYGFENDILHCYFSGFANKDVAFFHPTSRTLIQADLLFNLPCTEQYSKSKSSGHIPIFGHMGPASWMHSKMTWSMGTDKDAMRRDVKTVLGWEFERIIPCHGDVIETGGKQAFRDAYKAYLD